MNNKKLKEFALNGLKQPNIQYYLNKHKDLWNSIKNEIHAESNNAGEKLWLVATDFKESKCKMCKNITKWNRKKRKYNTYCSSKCSNSDKDVKDKIKRTNIERYGGTAPLKNKKIQEKAKQTNLKRYGVEYTQQNKDIKEKAKQTNIKKYGVECPAQNKDVQEKTRQTNLKRYGVEYTPQNKVIKEKQLKTLNDNYGVSVPMKSNIIKEKVKKTQRKTVAKLGKYPSQYHIPIETLNLLKNKQFLYDEHITKQQSLTKIASTLKVDPETIRQYCIKYNIAVQSFFSSQGERDMNSFIQEFDIDTITNNRSIITPYELDIYIPEHKLAIEYCGLYWHSEQAGKDKHYHKRKHDLCQKKGIQLITIFEDEWEQRQNQVKSKILSLIQKDNRERTYARKTNIEVLNSNIKKDFLEQYHIQGDGPSSINLGLTYNDNIVAVMCFIQQDKKTYLNRYATSTHVIGGFSKLLKYFEQNYNYEQLISFADLRWSNGNLYETNGWKLDTILKPDYSYSINYINRCHKFSFRRKNLPILLDNFKPELSEKENCDNNGILRIWDCGKYRYVKQKLSN